MNFRKIVKIIPNMLTCLRIAGALTLLFIKPYSTAFFIVYTACGATDVLDGFVARIAKCSSKLGAKLDSIADLVFYTVMLLRILPLLLSTLTIGLWCWLGAIILLRIAAYMISAFKHRQFASLHTYWNKATGLLVFLVPYVIQTPYFIWYAGLACSVASLAVADELRIHCSKKKDTPKEKTPV